MQARLSNITYRLAELGDNSLLCLVDNIEAVDTDKQQGNNDKKITGAFITSPILPSTYVKGATATNHRHHRP